MSSEQMIEEILMEAYSFGFREELIDSVNFLIENEPNKRKIDIYEEAFCHLLAELDK
jgi:hypothetical protein